MTNPAKDLFIRDFRMIRRAMASDRYDPEAIEYVEQLNDARRHMLCELYLVANGMPVKALPLR